jgi:hypothetical protein
MMPWFSPCHVIFATLLIFADADALIDADIAAFAAFGFSPRLPPLLLIRR